MADVNANTTMRTTTRAPFRLTPTNLQNLIRRNIRGLVRLFNIEWQDALNVSFYYIFPFIIFILSDYCLIIIIYVFITISINCFIFQQSEITVKEFQKDLGNQVGSFLQDNPNAF